VDAVKTRVHEGLDGLRAFLARKGIALGAVALASGLASEATASDPTLVATCVQTVITPAAAPGAAALAHGIVTAMIVKTATLIAAGLILAGSCLTAALIVGPEPLPLPQPVATTPQPVPVPPAVVDPAPLPQPVATTPQPAPVLRAVVKPAWATDFGTDQYGTWADLKVAEVIQRFRWIQPGTFTMGSSQAEKDAAIQSHQAKPEWVAPEVQHQVTLTQGFWLADSTCTQALWQAITGSNPARFKDSPQNPVERVSWEECQQFLSNLNDRVSGGDFCLPSEAQWEYACRAGTTTAFSFGSKITSEQVNFNGAFSAKGLFRQKTVQVKTLPPNAWGLYEMHGNVLQWCNDWYGDLSGNAERDPAGPLAGFTCVARGGSWYHTSELCRSALRLSLKPDFRYGLLGFRIAVQATPTSGHVGPRMDF
jgi:sulfatase modifying factor 1